jgi:hypothetical protein
VGVYHTLPPDRRRCGTGQPARRGGFGQLKGRRRFGLRAVDQQHLVQIRRNNRNHLCARAQSCDGSQLWFTVAHLAGAPVNASAQGCVSLAGRVGCKEAECVIVEPHVVGQGSQSLDLDRRDAAVAQVYKVDLVAAGARQHGLIVRAHRAKDLVIGPQWHALQLGNRLDFLLAQQVGESPTPAIHRKDVVAQVGDCGSYG